MLGDAELGKRLQEPRTQGVDIRLLLMKFHVEALPGMGVTALDLACLDSLEFGKLAQSRVLCAARHLYGAFVAAAAPPGASPSFLRVYPPSPSYTVAASFAVSSATLIESRTFRSL